MVTRKREIQRFLGEEFFMKVEFYRCCKYGIRHCQGTLKSDLFAARKPLFLLDIQVEKNRRFFTKEIVVHTRLLHHRSYCGD